MSIPSIVNSFLSETGTVGAIVSVQEKGVTTYSEGFGAIAAGGAAPAADDSFQIDSLTKTLTALAVLTLHEQGTIDLRAQLGTYLPSLPNAEWGKVRIDQLLAMVSGIPDSSSATTTYLKCLESVAKEPMLFTPGTKYDYSNSNYFLLGMLIDHVAPDYPTYVRHVLNVFGMSHTGLIAHARAANPVTPYLDHKPQSWRSPLCGYSAGGFASTMADLETYATGLANGELLTPETYALMWTNYRLDDGSYGKFGLGWEVTRNVDGSVRQVAKDGGGWGWGWGSYLLYAPPARGGLTGGTSVCVLINNNVDAGALAREIYKAVAEPARRQWHPLELSPRFTKAIDAAVKGSSQSWAGAAVAAAGGPRN